MAFAGRWYLTEVVGLDEFVEKNAADPAKLAPLLPGLKATGPDGYVEEFAVVDGSRINRKVIVGGKTIRDTTGPVGEEFDGQSFDGRPAKIFVKKLGDGQFERRETVDGNEIISTTKPDGLSNITITTVGRGVSLVRKFQKA